MMWLSDVGTGDVELHSIVEYMENLPGFPGWGHWGDHDGERAQKGPHLLSLEATALTKEGVLLSPRPDTYRLEP